MVLAEAARNALRGALRGVFRSAAYQKHVVPLRNVIRLNGWRTPTVLATYLSLALGARLHRHFYRTMSESDLRARRRSETLFVFGSGFSLNEISDQEWARIAEHDVLGANYFVHQRWVDVDYHYIRELEGVGRQHFSSRNLRQAAQRFCDLATGNPRFRDTVFLLQTDFYSEAGRQIVSARLLPKGQPVFYYRGRRAQGAETGPSRALSEGLPRQAGALGAGISIGRALGWKRIVLAGVDLYDARYFWLPPGETRNPTLSSSNQRHPTAGRGIVATMAAWRSLLAADGVELLVYNPRSLLAGSLPLFRWQDGLAVHAGRSTS